MYRECEFCGKSFIHEHKGKMKFCSAKCRVKRHLQRTKEIAKHGRQSRICAFCSVEFIPMRNDSKCCSSFCRTEKIRFEKMEQSISKRVEAGSHCEECGKEVPPERRFPRRYCSDECLYDFRRKQQNQKKAEKRANTIRTCPTCEKQFTPLTTLYQKYCCETCRKLFPKKIYSMMRRVYQKAKIGKQGESHSVLGYTPTELRKRIQSHPNWESVKDTDWQLDHIFPIKAFSDYGIRDISLICCLDNLQPLAKHDNFRKRGGYSKPDFEKWLKSKAS